MGINEILIDEEMALLEVMKKMDKVAKKILFVANEGKLLASLTDGDIRRGILRNGNLDLKVKEIANYSPKFLNESDNQRAKQYMKENQIEVMPIVDEKKQILTVISLNDDEAITTQSELIDLPVVIMAGGFGTRLYPYTKILPKPLIPIGDLPIIEHIINRFYAKGCRDFYLIVNYKKKMIKAYFNELEKDYNITFIDEEKPLGTGGGIGLCRNKINRPFILTNCDVLIDGDFSKICQFHKEKKSVITMICSLNQFRIPYGVIEMGEDGNLDSMQEKPTIPFLINTGCYVVDPEVMDYMGTDKKVDFPVIIQQCKKLNQNVKIYPISEDSWLDMGELDELEKMKQKLRIVD